MLELTTQVGNILLSAAVFAPGGEAEPGIVAQIGGLLLSAVPTIVLFIILVTAYQFLIQGPLSRTLAERRARTEGALEEAQKAIARAEARAADYDAQLRQARVEMVKAREQVIKQGQAERDAALEQARTVAKTRVSEARARIEAETAHARSGIEAVASELAAQVVRAVAPAAGGSR